MTPQLVAIALATLASEDLTCIATGVLVAQGKIGPVEGTLACLAGIFAGDLLLFALGRLCGPAVLRWSLLARLAPPDQVARASAWIQQRGLRVILLSRFTPGLRLPTYFAAGLLATRARSFVAYFLIAAAIWTPLAVGAAALAGDEILQFLFSKRTGSLLAFAAVSGVVFAGIQLVRYLARYRQRLRWEFWPAWLAYVPVAPYIFFLGLRHRSLTLFTAANPGIPSGGLKGESKSEILDHLNSVDGAVAAYAVIAADLDLPARVRAARRFMQRHEVDYPIMLKPDAGERGTGVAVIRSDDAMSAYLEAATGDTIVQRYVDGAEFGVFYYRYPHQTTGRIFSITEKHFPEVVGDGRRTIGELILADSRASCMAKAYRRSCPRPMADIPERGERVRLVEIGSHCRGAIFLDGRRLHTAALASAIDRISKAHPGFYFGRYDIRTPSIADLREGRNFQVIELNGVAAEATHIYDPSVSVLEAYRLMYRQWRIAFEIGAENRDRGVRPMPLLELWACVRGAKRGPRHWAVQPPSIRMSVPVMKPASSEHRYSASAPISSTFPHRPTGILERN